MEKIIFLGAGNVATQLSIALKTIGFEIIQIFSRTLESAQTLANKLNTSYTTNLSEISQDADIYFYTVNDDAIAELFQQFYLKNKISVHCAGSVDASVFRDEAENYGVFYPLQTFKIHKTADFKNIPICIEANNSATENRLLTIANLLSTKVFIVNSEQRRNLHLAGVFACNFVNYMYCISDDILKANHLSFDILKPLILQTAMNVEVNPPKAYQTGPAIRNDKKTMEMHLELLNDYPNYKKIYSFVSNCITTGEW